VPLTLQQWYHSQPHTKQQQLIKTYITSHLLNVCISTFQHITTMHCSTVQYHMDYYNILHRLLLTQLQILLTIDSFPPQEFHGLLTASPLQYQFLFVVLIFLFPVQCGRLRWLSFSFLSYYKHFVSYTTTAITSTTTMVLLLLLRLQITSILYWSYTRLDWVTKRKPLRTTGAVLYMSDANQQC